MAKEDLYVYCAQSGAPREIDRLCVSEQIKNLLLMNILEENEDGKLVLTVAERAI